ncbi:glycoside hydrolase family 35 protein [Aaosphaeria arxii CBS 175.79]|uniref:Glycoside hydrolase family 35 protein n=1 Tax=Aaosphaeria arxii CBS 175.79 TaxID=1450172 RepID=A0A6A5YAA8_9PLEO|nr:glycoside hydrolase family 35 protein [Aaosphaeria arxii CBS 175.79]KAF2022378.1 glycoside hydrolase family 35 protein [Aaosphaeria arxii CBS 175.79]
MSSQSTIPHLQQYGNTHQVVVNGKPFLILGAELQNSSLSSAEYMAEVWPKMVDTNINTVLGAVTWEMIEPQEGRFDFEELDKVILDARSYNIHIVLLWFGSFKNGRSTYTPAWIKTDPKRFPRAEIRKAGGVIELADSLSLFSEENVQADIKAFSKLLSHIKEVDEGHNTVLMVQVENEPGLLFDSRDGSDKANEVFSSPVPSKLTEFLDTEYDGLHVDLKKNLKPFVDGKVRSGGWEDIFGKSSQTDELFMAYHYATYIERVASAGKEAYPIILYTNVWQNYAGDDTDNQFPVIVGGGGNPGDYPSGGGTSNVLDIWLRFAPSLDFIAPDVYLNEYDSSCAKYRHKNNPLFIPEQRRDEYGVRRIWKAYGSFQALCTSPFGIDTLEPATNPFTKHYGLLSEVSQIVLEAQRKPDSCFGFYFDDLPEGWQKGDKDPSKPVTHRFGDWTITVSRCFVFGKPGSGSGMVIHQGGGRFLLIGWGFHVAGESRKAGSRWSGILNMAEKKVVDREAGTLKTVRVLGGDETRSGSFALMPNENPDYGGFPIAVTIPARTGIAEVEFYSI